MARMCRIGRRKVVVAVVCMWSSILQQYACLLMDVYMLMLWLRGESIQHRLPEHRIPLPLSRVIYRIGFLAYFQGLQSRFDKFEENLGNTCVNIERIANTFCKDDSLFEKRMSLFDELSSFEELSRQQVLQATRKLMNDDGEAATYFRMRTEAEKVKYILFMLQ